MNRLLKYIFTTVAALCFALSLTAQQTEDSGPPDSQKNNAPEVRVAPTSDLFTDEIRKARQLHSQWNGLDDELDQARSGALLTDPAVYKRLRSQIDTVLASKRVEIDAWRGGTGRRDFRAVLTKRKKPNGMPGWTCDSCQWITVSLGQICFLVGCDPEWNNCSSICINLPKDDFPVS